MEEEVFTIVTSDKQEFRVLHKVAIQCGVISNLVMATQATELRLDGERSEGMPEINSATLKLVLAYCTWHTDNPAPKDAPARSLRPDDMDDWDKTFVSEQTLDQASLFNVLLAANYLDIKGLLDVTCKGLANRLKGKAPKEIIEYFGKIYTIEKEYTPEEEVKVRKEHPWIENPKAKI